MPTFNDIQVNKLKGSNANKVVIVDNDGVLGVGEKCSSSGGITPKLCNIEVQASEAQNGKLYEKEHIYDLLEKTVSDTTTHCQIESVTVLSITLAWTCAFSKSNQSFALQLTDSTITGTNTVTAIIQICYIEHDSNVAETFIAVDDSGNATPTSISAGADS